MTDSRQPSAPSLPPGSFEEKFTRSGGHGGQNVNKVSTTVQLRFFPRLAGLEPETIARLERLAGSKLTEGGDILITASEYRTQEQNRQAARQRLLELLAAAHRREKKRRPTRPSFGAKKRRLEGKKRRSEIKRGRGADYF
ncbi:MAG: aminoacyl-tRNA hydrolase [Elusimicrobia bacterium]|nr:aminoacyl-tRNA hydrolase [Elusimicrobiota bacterium]